VTRLVYSTGPEGADDDGGETCPRCGPRPCRCNAGKILPPAAHAIVVRRERSGRRGKTVTLAGPFNLAADEAAALLKQLKRHCGCGGTLKGVGREGRTLEIQGDQVARVAEHLAGLGYRVKRSGQ
jgi:translation initiation factor 1